MRQGHLRMIDEQQAEVFELADALAPRRVVGVADEAPPRGHRAAELGPFVDRRPARLARNRTARQHQTARGVCPSARDKHRQNVVVG
jgi:hypothetical protein